MPGCMGRCYGNCRGWTTPNWTGPCRTRTRFTTTKLRALLWCARHEMLHAGQIGLLRRHLGYPPMW